MLESRKNYGYGYVGSSKNGFEWLLIYGEEAHERLRSGYVYKTEEKAIREGQKFQNQSTHKPYRQGRIIAVESEPLHFEY